jgi:hypothetical protein
MNGSDVCDVLVIFSTKEGPCLSFFHLPLSTVWITGMLQGNFQSYRIESPERDSKIRRTGVWES